MRYKLKCKKCGATCWVKGEDDPETNGFELTEEPHEWDDGQLDCPHDDYEVVNEEDDFDPDLLWNETHSGD